MQCNMQYAMQYYAIQRTVALGIEVAGCGYGPQGRRERSELRAAKPHAEQIGRQENPDTPAKEEEAEEIAEAQ
jgi:hypothetical protein